jgi:hydantoinase/carbamoylase family amidase
MGLESLVERAKTNLLKLGSIGKTDTGGVSRPLFSPAYFDALRYVMGLMKEVGLEVCMDMAGNVIGKRPGNDNRLLPVTTGSHIDTVPNGGIFDGAVGVIGAIEAIRLINQKRLKTLRPIKVVVFSNEEGVRFPPLLGSKALAGLLKIDEILRMKDAEGITFKKALESGGYNVEGLPDPAKLGKAHSFVELHIEQGPILESLSCDIGVVKSITGVRQIIASFKGEAGHAGCTPMKFRKDALLGAAASIIAINKIVKTFGAFAVGTVGWIDVYPRAVNVICQEAKFSIDLRHPEKAKLEKIVRLVVNKIGQIARSHSLEYKVSSRLQMEPTKMSPRIVRVIEETTNELGYRYAFLNSGAYHDTVMMSKITECGMIFVPSHKGVSHSPQEFTHWDHIAKGINVLANVLIKLANS